MPDPEAPNEAQLLVETPDAKVKSAVAEAAEASGTADSLYAAYFRQEDNSVVVVSSWRGSEPLTRAFKSPELIPDDLAFQHIPEEAQAGLEEAEAKAAEIAESKTEEEA